MALTTGAWSAEPEPIPSAVPAMVAAKPATPLVWTFTYEEGFRTMRGGNSQVQAARSTFEAAQEAERQAFSPFLPVVSASLGLNYGSDTSETRRWTSSLTATQNLFSGYGDTARYQQARAATTAARSTLQIAEAQALFDLRSAFAAWQYSRGSRELQKTIVTRRADNLQLVKLRFESGRENRGSLLLSEAYLAQAKYEALVADDARRVAEAQVARALGMESQTGERLEFDLHGEIPIHAPPAGSPSFVDLARRVPEVQRARAQAAGAERAIAAARADFFPSVDARGTVGSYGPGITPIERDTWSLGVSLTLPLFSGYRTTYAVRSAAASLRASEFDSSTAYQQALQRLEQAFSTYREAVVKLDVDERFRSAATLRAEIARKKYNNGLLSFEDWDQIENDLITRQRSYLVSKRERIVAEAAWDQTLGFSGGGP